MSALSLTAARELHCARFGEYGRYCLRVMQTRFGCVEFFVADAAKLDPETGLAAIVRQSDSLAQALDGLEDLNGGFCQRPSIGDFVINLDSFPAVVDSFHPETGEPVLCSLQRRDRWIASFDKVVAIK